MGKRSMPIDDVIAKLGYAESDNLFYFQNDIGAALSLHDKKMINLLKPYAYYIINNKPFILFFEKQIRSDISVKDISRAVWNAQIPVVVFCDDNAVRFFNGTSLEQDSWCIREVDSVSYGACDERSGFSFWNISDPLFWDKYNKVYSKERLNQSLLHNITYLTNQLQNTYKLKFATKLVLRLIFIRYLIDRGIALDYRGFDGNIQESQSAFLDIISSKSTVYELFMHLKSKFNGNLFELGNEMDSEDLTEDVFMLLKRFFEGNEQLENGQYCLFTMYDFNLIPIELISNVYEILLGAEGRKKDNAFYTPNYLVEYILDHVTNADLKAKKEFSVLDPACGSGVFLVNSYRRMVEEYLNGEQYSKDDELLKRLLTDNIFGVDINEAAVDVTIFSLYLTVLDYKNPKTLKSFQLPNLKERNLFVGDFFDEEKMRVLEGRHFDYIIGNPPWGNVKTGLHISYCSNHGYKKMQQNNEICRSFVFRAKDFADHATTCCFVLHSKILYNKEQPAKEFRKFMLKNARINRILELSAVRKLMFDHAKAPAAVLSFQFSKEQLSSNTIVYTTVMPNIFHKLFHVFVIEKRDIKYIPQVLLLSHDWAWKTILFGTSFDVDVIRKMKQKFNSFQEVLRQQEPKLICANGIQYLDGEDDALYLKGRDFLRGGIDHFSIDYDAIQTFDKEKIHRARAKNKNAFNPPYVVITKGLDMNNYKMKGVYSERSFVSSDTIYVLKGESEQKDFLYNTEGLINSSMYAYFNIMLGSSVGIEREQRFMGEVFEYPYIFSQKCVEIVNDIHLKTEETKYVDLTEEMEALDSTIMDVFGVNGDVFIDYALRICAMELLNKDIDEIYRRILDTDMREYSRCFYEHFTAIYNRAEKFIHISLYPAVGNGYAVMELTIVDNNEEQGIFVTDAKSQEKDILSKFGVYAYNEKFYQIKDVTYFSTDSFYIIKPNRYKYWHPAIAKLDLADVAEQIMHADGGAEQ